jgi:hypothetical protein
VNPIIFLIIVGNTRSLRITLNMFSFSTSCLSWISHPRTSLVLTAIASGWDGTAESVMFHQGVAVFELPQVGRDLHASHSFHGADLPGQQVVEVLDITASDRCEEVRRTGCGADELDFRELTEGVPGSF